MGVVGLTSFIANEKRDLLEPYRLHDTKVVIDGNNLCHHLYYNFHLSVWCGGEYDLFAKHLRAFFQALGQCNIKPYIVMDGAYNADDRKFSTTLARFNNRLQTAARIASGQTGGVLPIAARQVFIGVLHDLDVWAMTCDYEADNDLAVLANHLDCPVISNDSDFYIYNVKSGFIPLDYLDINKKTTGTCHYISVRRYQLTSLLKEFNCPDPRMAALMATIIGNDFVGSSKMIDFYSMMNLPARRVTYLSGKKSLPISKGKERIERIFNWIKSSATFDCALQRLITACTSRKSMKPTDNVEQLIRQNIIMYETIECGATCYMDTGEINSQTSVLCDRVPLGFLRAFRHCTIEPDLFNARLVKRVMLMPQVEDINSPSSYVCSSAVRSLVYSVILNPVDCVELDKSTSLSVCEYDRDVLNTVKRNVTMLTAVDDFGQLPSLNRVTEMDKARRQQLFLIGLQCPELGCEFPHLTVLIAVCVYWVKNGNPRPALCHVQALLLTFIRIRVVKALKTGNGNGDEFVRDLIGSDVSTLDRRALGPKFAKIRDEHTRLDLSVIQALAQFQTCYLAASQLCQVLDEPFERLRVDHFFNGRLAHALALELKSRRQPKSYIEDLLCGEKSVISRLFSGLLEHVIQNTNGFNLSQCSVAKKSRRKKKPKAKNVDVECWSNGEGDCNAEDAAENAIEVTCDVSNKFALLSLSQKSQ